MRYPSCLEEAINILMGLGWQGPKL